MPALLPVWSMSVSTVAPSAGVPVQPVIAVKDVSVVPVYEQVPVTPSTVNVPLESKPSVEATLSVPPGSVWPAPLTVVVRVPENAARSIVWPFSVAPSMSIVASSGRPVLVRPILLIPLSFSVAWNVMFPVPTSIVLPESTLIVSALTVRFEFGTR